MWSGEPCAGCDTEPGGLVDDDEGIVLEDDVERQRLRTDLEAGRRLDRKAKQVAGFEDPAGFGDRAVDVDGTAFDRVRHVTAR